MPEASNVLITAVIKARNEEKNIVECLRSLEGFAGEIIVVNDGSTDATKELALGLGAQVIDAESGDRPIECLDIHGWNAARGRWLITIDADERMTPALAAKLREIAQENRYRAVRFARQNVMFGAVAYHGGWFEPLQLRFMRADAWDRNWTAEIHTFPQIAGKVLTLPANPEWSTLHCDYQSVEQFIRRTLLGYAKKEADGRLRKGVKFSLLRLIFRPPRVFFGRLIVRNGWRDGPRGVVLAGLLACYAFLIEALLWDLERMKR